MTTTGFQHLKPDQTWITAGGTHLYGEEAEQYLQVCIRALNRVCRSAQQLLRTVECELKQRSQVNDMVLYVLSTDEMFARITIYCEIFLDEYGELQETQP